MIPRFGEWEKRYGARGLTVVGVHSPETDAESDPKGLREYVRSQGIEWKVVLDSYHEAWKRYGADAWPTVLLIDRGGIVRAVHVGDDRAAEIEREIERLLAS
jgi:hypothetical protein